MKNLFIATLIFVLFASHGFAEEKKAPGSGGMSSLDLAADEMKFKNGLMFLEINRPQKAINELAEYLDIYYNGVHRHEAYHIIGDIYFSRMEYQQAIKKYQALYEEFNNSESGIEAYYKIGICYSKMGFDAKASAVFKGIIEDHSASVWARQAQVQLDLIDILVDEKKSVDKK